jgi:hypothetical protein
MKTKTRQTPLPNVRPLRDAPDDTVAKQSPPLLPPRRPSPSDVEITAHARERWQQRIDDGESRPDLALLEAFLEGLRVGHPRAGDAKARLFPPANALLLFRGPEQAPTVVTVYPATSLLADDALNVDHLQVCATCRQLADPQRSAARACPWCSTPLAFATPAPHAAPDEIVPQTTTTSPNTPE